MKRSLAWSILVLTALAMPSIAADGLELPPIGDEASFIQYVHAKRSAGPDGLRQALVDLEQAESHAAKLQQTAMFTCADPEAALAAQEEAEARADALRGAVDLIARQRGASVSRLYWQTDLDEAKAAAALTGKPILSLRMLGKLTDEYSCANSRFFRTALYANKEISDYLRDHFILHWQSVRPVPRVTIDFGDGRKLERTVTGNSAHYVLDATGRPLDVLPGLYGPRAFFDWLKQSEMLVQQIAESDPAAFDEILKRRHGYALAALEQRLERDVAATVLPAAPFGEPDHSAAGKRNVNAIAAGSRAVSKTFAEAPIVRMILPDDERLFVKNDETWQKIAALHRDEAILDAASREVMRRETPGAQAAGDLSTAKRAQEDPLLRMVRRFEANMALDAVKNEYQLHRKIHEWFITGDAPADFDELNEKVYAELFLTPSSDPWLGLAPADAYTALENGGLTTGAAIGASLLP